MQFHDATLAVASEGEKKNRVMGLYVVWNAVSCCDDAEKYDRGAKSYLNVRPFFVGKQ